MDNLLVHEEPHYDCSDGSTNSVITNPKILELFGQFVQLEDLNSDLEMGVRKQVDVVEHEQSLGEF